MEDEPRCERLGERRSGQGISNQGSSYNRAQTRRSLVREDQVIMLNICLALTTLLPMTVLECTTVTRLMIVIKICASDIALSCELE